MAPDSDNNNGRVTLAVLGEKMDNLSSLLATHITDEGETRKDHETRIRYTEQEVARLGQRQKQATGILASIQFAVIGAATWLGLRQ